MIFLNIRNFSFIHFFKIVLNIFLNLFLIFIYLFIIIINIIIIITIIFFDPVVIIYAEPLLIGTNGW